MLNEARNVEIRHAHTSIAEPKCGLEQPRSEHLKTHAKDTENQDDDVESEERHGKRATCVMPPRCHLETPASESRDPVLPGCCQLRCQSTRFGYPHPPMHVALRSYPTQPTRLPRHSHGPNARPLPPSPRSSVLASSCGTTVSKRARTAPRAPWSTCRPPRLKISNRTSPRSTPARPRTRHTSTPARSSSSSKKARSTCTSTACVTRAGPGSLLFYASNDLHNVTNVGTTAATYLVFNYETVATRIAPAEGAAAAKIPGASPRRSSIGKSCPSKPPRPARAAT